MHLLGLQSQFLYSWHPKTVALLLSHAKIYFTSTTVSLHLHQAQRQDVAQIFSTFVFRLDLWLEPWSCLGPIRPIFYHFGLMLKFLLGLQAVVCNRPFMFAKLTDIFLRTSATAYFTSFEGRQRLLWLLGSPASSTLSICSPSLFFTCRPSVLCLILQTVMFICFPVSILLTICCGKDKYDKPILSSQPKVDLYGDRTVPLWLALFFHQGS